MSILFSYDGPKRLRNPKYLHTHLPFSYFSPCSLLSLALSASVLSILFSLFSSLYASFLLLILSLLLLLVSYSSFFSFFELEDCSGHFHPNWHRAAPFQIGRISRSPVSHRANAAGCGGGVLAAPVTFDNRELKNKLFHPTKYTFFAPHPQINSLGGTHFETCVSFQTVDIIKVSFKCKCKHKIR